MSIDPANVALAPSLYEPEILEAAITILERERDLYYEEARYFGMHHSSGRRASQNARRVAKLARACRKAL